MEKELNVRMANDKCKCKNCLFGFFGGFTNWKCVKYKEGKPDDVLYENKECPKFKPR